MRNGICTIQQALTADSATVVKQAITLARRRGHAQVTPLHVASAMLAAPAGLLRTSCLRSHSHPLQCQALELCFNAALNRLPAATASGPILGGAHLSPTHPPLLSNALVASFKRAQAHQRRGSVESQQQPILALKIELKQLVISILDDPSVSRVMREAGFSSTHIKSSVEQAVSIEVVIRDPAHPNKTQNEPQRLPRAKSDEEVSSGEDSSTIVESILGKKRNTVVIRESVASAERAVRAAIDELKSKSSVQFLSFPVLSMRNLSQDETEQKLSEIRALVRSGYAGRGIVVLYLGDIEGISEFWHNHVENRRGYHFCSLENAVMEIKKWCSGGLVAETKRVWVVGAATSSSYIKCKGGQPSLESVWELHPITLPSCSLSLTLTFSPSQPEARRKEVKRSGLKWTLFGHGGDDVRNDNKPAACCNDCILNFNKEVHGMSAVRATGSSAAANGLPSWLQQYKDEKTGDSSESQSAVNIKNLCKKWSSFCGAFHRDSSSQYPEKLLEFSSTHSLPTTSNFQLVKEEVHVDDCEDNRGDDMKPQLLSNPNSSPNSASSSEIMEDSADYSPAFNEHTALNVKILTDALESKVPWQRDVIPEMVNTILRCRSRKLKETTWMAFLGPDSISKKKVARELGKTVYGSHSGFVSVASPGIVTEISSRKRAREEMAEGEYLKRFEEEAKVNPHRMFFLEGFDQADKVSKVGITRAMRSGKLSVGNKESVCLHDAIIIIITNDSYGSMPPGGSPKRRQVSKEKEEGEVREKEEAHDGDSDKKTKAMMITCDMLDLNVAVEDDCVDDDDDNDLDSRSIMDLVDGKFIFNIQQV